MSNINTELYLRILDYVVKTYEFIGGISREDAELIARELYQSENDNKQD